ncbi:MAG: ATP-grasp domain-containing protein [Myxococcales bacterium]|nr:ATP-grasp domain-containing protein [Myxococcales bacterium]
MIVVSQAPLPLSDHGDDIVASTRAALASGFDLISLPPALLRPEEVAEALADVPARPAPEPAVWIGTIPDESVYRAVFHALAQRNVHLLNDPEAHLEIFEFDRAYPKIADLTARSRVITDLAQIDDAIRDLGLPVFIKGSLLSRKHSGWRACVADTADDLRRLAASLLRQRYLSRGRAVIRELLPLRRFTVPAGDFPVGREFRVFLLRGEPLAHGYYWPYTGDWAALSPAEETAVLDLARRAARRFAAPLVALDIGQLEDMSWRVIETGDPQFSGLSFIDPRTLWRNLAARLSGTPHT